MSKISAYGLTILTCSHISDCYVYLSSKFNGYDIRK